MEKLREKLSSLFKFLMPYEASECDEKEIYDLEKEFIENSSAIYIVGAKDPFLSQKEYLDALENVVSQGAYIGVVAGKSDNAKKLSDIVSRNRGIFVAIDKELTKGFRIFYDSKTYPVSMWNSEKNAPSYKKGDLSNYKREVHCGGDLLSVQAAAIKKYERLSGDGLI